MKTTKFQTKYTEGFSILLPTDFEVFKMSPEKRDEWAIKFLKLNKIKKKDEVFVRFCDFDANGKPTKMRIDSFNYKSLA